MEDRLQQIGVEEASTFENQARPYRIPSSSSGWRNRYLASALNVARWENAPESAESGSEFYKEIAERGTIEGAPGLKPEHLPVFDCSFRALNGTRSIYYMGHVRMMGAGQPFLSGAISKTVNLPTGHRITGNRRGQARGVGWEFVHVAIVDASRLAYVEVL